MDGNPPKLFSIVDKINAPADPKADVVDLLEKLLARARAGEVDSIAVCYTTPEPDGEHLFQSCWEGPRITLLGAMTRQLYALNRQLDSRDKGHVFDGG